MKIRLTETCEFGETGDVLEPDMPDIANLLIQRGVGVPQEAIDPEPSPVSSKPRKFEHRSRKAGDIARR